jgi:hypothetical protein
VNHGVICEASGCESLSVILRECLLIMVCNAEQLILNHGELCCDSGCDSWCIMPIQSL